MTYANLSLCKTIYKLFQAQVLHEVGNISARNRCAMEYRLLDEQHPTKRNNDLVMVF